MASAVGQAIWAVTPVSQRAPHPPAEDVDYLLDFAHIDLVGGAYPEAMDAIIAWLEKLVSTMRRLTATLHVSLQCRSCLAKGYRSDGCLSAGVLQTPADKLGVFV